MSTTRRLGALGGAFALGMLLTGGVPARAASSVESGWWTSAPAALAPDASPDQLVVQGGADPSQPLSYAAVSFALDAGETPTSLKLTVAPSSATTPNASLAACALSGSVSAAQGGASSEGPTFDCGSKVTAAPSADGSSYTFDVSSLAGDGDFAVAIVPTAATDRVVFQKPDVAALTSTAGSSGGDSSSGTDGEVATDAGTFGATEPSSELALDLPAPSASAAAPLDLGPAPAPPAMPAPVAPSAPPAPRGPAIEGQPISAASSSSSSRLPAVAFVALTLLAGALWFGAGRTSTRPDDERAVA